jgi:Holliday junction resolvasome RuvABC ATP-dependent DNA helicase subunit
MIDRFYRVQIPDYNAQEMAAMLLKYCPGITFQGKVSHEIIEVCRANPRNISQRISNNIINYLISKNRKVFNSADWKELRNILGIRPAGITDDEYKVLKFLKDAPHTLTALSVKLQLDQQTIRRDIESFLVQHDYMQIMGTRFITHKGEILLKEIEEWENKNQ